MEKLAMKKTDWNELKKKGYNTCQILRKVGELKDKGLTQDESVIFLQELAKAF